MTTLADKAAISTEDYAGYGEILERLTAECDQLRALAERYRLALQDVQGIALNGTEVGQLADERLCEIDRLVTEVLPHAD